MRYSESVSLPPTQRVGFKNKITVLNEAGLRKKYKHRRIGIIILFAGNQKLPKQTLTETQTSQCVFKTILSFQYSLLSIVDDRLSQASYLFSATKIEVQKLQKLSF
jgi:hypothetical protein